MNIKKKNVRTNIRPCFFTFLFWSNTAFVLYPGKTTVLSLLLQLYYLLHRHYNYAINTIMLSRVWKFVEVIARRRFVRADLAREEKDRRDKKDNKRPVRGATVSLSSRLAIMRVNRALAAGGDLTFIYLRAVVARARENKNWATEHAA